MHTTLKDEHERIQEFLSEDINMSPPFYDNYLYNNHKLNNLRLIIDKMMEIEKRKIKLMKLLSGYFTNNEWEYILKTCYYLNHTLSRTKMITCLLGNSKNISRYYAQKFGIDKLQFKTKIINLTRGKLKAIAWLLEYRLYSSISCNVDDEVWIEIINDKALIRKNKIQQIHKLSRGAQC